MQPLGGCRSALQYDECLVRWAIDSGSCSDLGLLCSLGCLVALLLHVYEYVVRMVHLRGTLATLYVSTTVGRHAAWFRAIVQ